MINRLPSPELKLDPWTASSLLQKAIRRGETSLACWAAVVLHRHRGKAIWRRLMHIAVEDVGIADLAPVTDVARLATNKKLRDVLGSDTELLRKLCERMATAPKDRSADYLYCAATKLPIARRERHTIWAKSAAEQIEVASNPGEPLTRRAVAILLACTSLSGDGAGRADARLMRALVGPLRDRPAFDAVELIAGARGHAFSLMLLLLSDELGSVSEHAVEKQPLPQKVSAEGLPLYIFDKHTSAGKRAISKLVQENKEVGRILKIGVREENTVKVALMAAFYADAVPVLDKLKWGHSQWLEAIGFEADMTSAGCPRAAMEQVLGSVRDNLGHLNELRAQEARLRVD